MPQIQEESRQVTMSINEMILIQLRDLKDSQREMNNRMDRIERRMDKLEDKIEKQNAKIEKLADKIDENRKELNAKIDANQKELNARIDKLSDKIDASSNHGQIATISTVGIGIAAVSSAIGVLYTLFFK